MNELTIELTDYCPHACKYCSTGTTTNRHNAKYLPFEVVRKVLGDYRHRRIILSGGEPLAHPDFYDILLLCKASADDVIVYSNAITHLAYNASVVSEVYLEVALTVPPEVDRVRVLRRVKQGREKSRPEVSLSRNFEDECSCDHPVLRVDGSIADSPCNKEAK